MQTDYRSIKKSFEKSMKDYDKNAVVQTMTAGILLAELCKISNDFENILEIGAGTGLLTRHLIKSVNFKNFYANDLVEKSKNYIEKIIPQVQFLQGNALKIKPAKKMDLIVSNAVFQWFPNLDKAIKTIKPMLKKDGILAFSTFAPDNFSEIKEITGLTLNYKSENDLGQILKNNGFKVLYAKTFNQVLEFGTPLELLAHMKHTGVNSLSEKTWTVKKVKEFCDKYSQKYPKPQLTYSPVIFICKNNLPVTELN